MKLPQIFKRHLLFYKLLLTSILIFAGICLSMPAFAVSSGIAEARPKPDLTPVSIKYTDTVTAGKLVGFDCLVKNAGTANSSGFAVKWYVNGKEICTGTHIGVPAGKSLIDPSDGGTLFYNFSTPGTYTVTILVDSNNEVAESNEKNNSLTISISVLSPEVDLIPTAITASATTNIKLGQKVTFDSGVKNAGSANAPGFSVKWLVNNMKNGYGGHEAVPANTTVIDGNSRFEYTFNSPGTYTITFQVDSDKVVSESNEKNNETSIIIKVPKTDLVPTGVSASATTNIKIGQPITFESGIKNNGGVDASNFYVKWLVNGTQVASNGYGVVPAYSTIFHQNGRLSYAFNAPGTYTITFQIDPDNKLNESDTSNNTASTTITILPADLVPTMVTTTECVYIKVGQQVTFKCGVRNDGGVGASAFNVKWFVDGVEVGAQSYPGVPARSTIAEISRLDYTFRSAGNHTVLFRVDSSDLIYEYNEIDNETTAIVNVTN
jgi:subtilase family serine protease